ncbi:MAG: hypothetical protein CEE42_07950 [Promethearchaeota archaeon Loki_b31]|nr:MAG: hypothetical protein CEE42_07950 [Candidatus Lokiarchaeota archaeon Loki_b31]
MRENDISSIDFIDVGERLDHEFTPPMYTEEFQELYNSFAGMIEIFRMNSVGIVTGQDTLVSHPDKERLTNIIKNFYNGEYSENLVDFFYVNRKKQREKGLQYKDKEINFNDNRDWKISDALKGNIKDSLKSIYKWVYRGFDQRYFSYYQPLLKNGTEQFKIMQYLYPEQDNLAICVDRGIQHIGDSNIAIISDKFVEHKGATSSTGSGTCVFPLKINTSDAPNEFGLIKPAKNTNINEDFKKLLPYDVENREIFNYIYGLLYVPQYRENFKVFLKKDFPRIPFPNDKGTFLEMSELGMKLIELHLLKSKEIRFSDCPYNELANDVENRKLRKIYYDPNEERMYFKKPSVRDPEKTFWLGGITEEIWNFEIGGKKQLKQWLSTKIYINPRTPKKNRLYHELRHNDDELDYFRKMTSAIKTTLDLQFPKIPSEDSILNKIYKKIMKNPHKFNIKELNRIVDKINNPIKKSQKSLTDFEENQS